MPTAVKKCRVCGKDYEACRTANKVPGVFRWQEVACSPECGAEYLRRVTEARSHIRLERESNNAGTVDNPTANVIEPVEILVAEPESQTADHIPE